MRGLAQGWVYSEGEGHWSRPVLTCTHTGSYLALPAVDLEALKAEFQDDSPASGTILGGRELVGGRHYLPGMPCPALPQGRSPQAGQPAPPRLPRDWALESGLSTSWGGVEGPGRPPRSQGHSWPCYDHPPHLPSVASTGSQVMTAQGKGSRGIRDTAPGAWVWPSLAHFSEWLWSHPSLGLTCSISMIGALGQMAPVAI